MAWEDFERLCLWLTEHDPRVDPGRLYGERGQDQEGIDLYAQKKDSDRYIVYQCKRVKTFGPADLKAAADQFLHVDANGNDLPPLKDENKDPIEPWHARADTFVLCMTRSLTTTEQDRAWRKVEDRLKARGIRAELWNAATLNRKLKELPAVVDEFFSRAWVYAFCGQEAGEALGKVVRGGDIAAVSQILDQLALDMADLRTGGIHLNDTGLAQLRNVLQHPQFGTSTGLHDTNPLPKSQLDRDLALVRELINGGAFSMAATRLTSLQAQAEAGSAAQQATLLRLRASLLYRQHRPGAAELYHQAYTLDPQAESAGILKGLAHLIQGEPDLALGFLHAARQQHPHRNDAHALYAHALHALGRAAEVAALEETLTQDQDELAFALTRIAMEQHDTAGMTRILSNLDHGPHARAPQKRLLEAKAVLIRLLNAVSGVYGDERTDRVRSLPEHEEALATLNALIPELDDPQHLRLLYLEALNARQVLYSLRGEDHLAVRDGETALKADPGLQGTPSELSGTLYDLALSYLRIDRPDDALALLERYGDEVLARLPSSRLIFAAAFRRRAGDRDAERALALLAPLLSGDDPELKLEALEEQVRVLIAQQRLTEARDALHLHTEPHFTVEYVRALIETAAQEDEVATRAAYDSAMRLVPEERRHWLTFEYAHYLTSVNDWKAAADLIRPLDLTTVPIDWLELAILYRYYGGRTEEARQTLDLLRRRGEPKLARTLEIEANLAALAGELGVAIPLYQAILERWPDRPATLVALTSAMSRLGSRSAQKVQALLPRLFTLPQTDASHLLAASQVAEALQLGRLARQLAYEAVRRGYDQEQNHLNLINILHHFPEHTDLTRVRAETAVQLQTEGQEPWWVVLTADPHPERSRQEYPLDDPLARLLLGKKVGTAVTSPSGARYTIKAILSKYDNAERAYLQNRHQLFPVSSSSRQLSMGDLEWIPRGLWDQLKAGHDRGIQLLREVQENGRPVLFLNLERQQPETLFWNHLLEHRLELLVSTLTSDEATEAAKVLRGGRVVVHVSALMVLSHARLLRKIASHLTVYVTRQTLDDVRRSVALTAQNLRGGSRTTMFFAEDRIQLAEEPLEAVERRLQRLKAVEKFIMKSAKVIPVLGILDVMERLPDHLAPGISAVLAAKQQNAPLLCDDRTFLATVKREGGDLGGVPDGVTSVLLAEALRQQQAWKEEDASNAMLNLAALRQVVIRFTDGDFKQLLDRDELHYTTLTAGVVANITYPNLPVATMAALLARLARALCLHAPLHLSRERWFVRVLDEALGERNLIELHDALQHALSEPFHLMPVDLSFMRDLIRRWADGKWSTRVGRPLVADEP